MQETPFRSEIVIVKGDDRSLSRAIRHLLEATPSEDRGSGLVFPDDPFLDRARPVHAIIALDPDPIMSLAETIGVRGVTPRMLETNRVWGLLDVGRVHLTAPDGTHTETILVAGLRAGLDLLARRTAAPEIRMSAVARHPRRPDAPMESWEWTGPLGLLAVMNAQHEGRLRVAPRAVPHDGLLDVLVGSGDRRDITAWIRRMPRGEHVPDREIAEVLATSLVIESSAPISLVLDGERYEAVRIEIEIERTSIALKV